MSRFVQLHLLTAYPPSNPNRDDLGRPKTAVYGGVTRQRISSQAIKRAIREHDGFRDALSGAIGERTQRLGEVVEAHVREKNADTATATSIARQVAGAFGKLKSEKDPHPTRIEQLAFISPDEKAFALELADRLLAKEELPDGKELSKIALRKADGAADIAMFGRMLADAPDFNREAAVQVAHALTTNRVDVDDDYYTAVDDLKKPSEDAGAGFIGEAGFGAGVYYLYICIDRALLLKNLAGDAILAARAIEALVKSAAMASPSGKKNSFANHVLAEFILAEKGDGQPLSLAGAFLTPIGAGDQVRLSRTALLDKRKSFHRAYPNLAAESRMLDVTDDAEESATLDAIAAFAAEGLDAVEALSQ